MAGAGEGDSSWRLKHPARPAIMPAALAGCNVIALRRPKPTNTTRPNAHTPPRARSSCVPSLLSWEFLLVVAQGGLLVSRSLLTDYVARIEGYAGRAITSLVGRGARGRWWRRGGVIQSGSWRGGRATPILVTPGPNPQAS